MPRTGYDHVNYQLADPAIKQAKYIVTTGNLSRQQNLDLCAVCHSGSTRTKERTTFRFKLGDTLDNFFSPSERRNQAQHPNSDVHGNQFQLLASSQCFIKSKTLTCTTCHDPHTNASLDLSQYSAKCINCHQNIKHSFDNSVANRDDQISRNCIDCHMPKQSSRAITYYVNGKMEKTAQVLRTHKIAVYDNDKEKVAAIASFLKGKI